MNSRKILTAALVMFLAVLGVSFAALSKMSGVEKPARQLLTEATVTTTQPAPRKTSVKMLAVGLSISSWW